MRDGLGQHDIPEIIFIHFNAGWGWRYGIGLKSGPSLRFGSIGNVSGYEPAGPPQIVQNSGVHHILNYIAGRRRSRSVIGKIGRVKPVGNGLAGLKLKIVRQWFALIGKGFFAG